jgi:glutaryl-CoA dehydrogenase
MWRDPLRLTRHLAPEVRSVITSTRSFALKHLRPRVRDDFMSEKMSSKPLRAMGNVGLLGCDDMGYHVYGAACREIERVDSGYRSMLSVQTSLILRPLKKYGTEGQQRMWLDKLTAGEMVGAFGLSESHSGSDPGSMRTTARYECGQWVLNGSKAWITNAPIADLFLIWARADDGIRGFWVPADTPGVSATPIKGKLAMRTSATGNVFLDNVKTPYALEHTPGLSTPLSILSGARYGISWGALGAAADCFERARNFVIDRSAFRQPLGSKQLVQESMAHMSTNLSTAWAACILADETNAVGVSLLKRNSTLVALDVARRARELMGANGISEEYDVMRHMANLEAVHTYEGTAHVHGLIIGRDITGMNAF